MLLGGGVGWLVVVLVIVLFSFSFRSDFKFELRE